MKVFRALLLIATPVSASGLDYDCSFRQLAYTYADKIVGSTRPATSMDRIAAALDLSDNATHPQPDGSAQLTWAGEPTNELRASSWIECPGTQSIQGGTCNPSGIRGGKSKVMCDVAVSTSVENCISGSA